MKRFRFNFKLNLCIIFSLCLLALFKLKILPSGNINENNANYAKVNAKDNGYIRQNGDYWVWHNYLRAEQYFKDNESITWTTHGSFQDLAMLPMLLHRWRAPISLTMFVNGDDFQQFYNSIGFINSCSKTADLLRSFVTIHLCFHNKHFPERLERISYLYTVPPLLCMDYAPFLAGKQTETYWYQHNLSYPINLLRNIARLNAKTHFILPLDMDLLPTPEFPKRFFKFLEERKTDTKKSIYCLPTFRHDFDTPLAYTKNQLRTLLHKNNKTKESYLAYMPLQRIKLWLAHKIQNITNISVFEVGSMNDMCVGYVSVNAEEPLYDERAVLESIYATPRNPQSLILKYLKFTFITLDGTFLFRRDQHSWKRVNTKHIKIQNPHYNKQLWNQWAQLCNYTRLPIEKEIMLW